MRRRRGRTRIKGDRWERGWNKNGGGGKKKTTKKSKGKGRFKKTNNGYFETCIYNSFN